MARLTRLAVPGHPHHLIQRGNDRQLVFEDAPDCRQYLQWLREAAAEQRVAIHAYVLMPNHVHLLATPAQAEGLSRMMQSLGRRYVRWFNRRHGRSGTLWEGRFRSSVIEAERHLLACMRYIELNPVRALLAADPAGYEWSSHRHHTGTTIDPLVEDHAVYWALGNTPFERQAQYRGLFEAPPEADFLDALRKATNRGWALGAPTFVRSLEMIPGRPLSPKPRGRPARTQSK